MNTPKWAIYGGGIALLAGGYWYYKSKQASSSSVNANAPTSMSTAPVNADVTGITDANGNLLPQFQWPYNQLALPFNYTGGNAATVANNVSYLSPTYVTGQNTVQYAA